MNYTFDEYIEVLRVCRSLAEINFVDDEINEINCRDMPMQNYMVLRGVVNLKRQIIVSKSWE